MNIIKASVKYLLLKLKFRRKIKFSFSSDISLSSYFEGGNLIGENTAFSGELGYGSYIANNSSLSAKVGRFCSIAPNVRCNNGMHAYKYPFISTSPWFFSNNPLKYKNGPHILEKTIFEELRYADKSKKFPIIIGNDCWIGEGAFIVGGVRIADGAMVLAHAVVTKDVPPYAIVGGVPAKVIGFRFSKEDIKLLMETKWWERDLDWIRANVNEFREFAAFRTKISESL